MGGEPTPPARPVGDVVVGTPAFVAAKIATPEVGPASVRPDVLDKLRAGGRKRLLLVRAPAGYGKTAVVSEASRRLGWRSVWYKLDVLDHDPAVLVASLVQGIRQLVADFGGILMERFANAHEAPMTQAEMVALLAAELQDEVDGPLHLVLDDYHEAVGSSGLNETLDHLVASLPGHIHIVLLTRCRPAMATSRLKLDGQLIEIGFDDLRLDAAQLADVLFERTGLRVSPDQAARLVRLTEGWPASVVLIGRALDWSDLDSIEAALTDPRITSDIFSYLSEEAVRHEDAEAATFMTATCCLDSMTVDLANQVARTDEAARLLDGLVGRNAFTFLDLSSGTYRYHQLFRDYLRHRFIQEHGKAAFHELQLWTAEAVETAGDRETAVELCFAANEPGAALAVVSRSGELITDNCRLETLDAWLERLPRYLRDHDPWGLFLQAQRSLREGSGEEALEALDRARALFEGSGDRWGAYHTLSSMEAIHFWKGAFEQAAAYCEKALAVAETPLQRMHTTVSLGSAHSYLAHWLEADKAWTAAESMSAQSSEAELARIAALRGNAMWLRGQFAQGYAELNRVLDDVRRSAGPLFTFLVLGVLADIAKELALYTTAAELIAECQNGCDRYGLEHLRHGFDETLCHVVEAIGSRSEAIGRMRKLSTQPSMLEDSFSFVFVLLGIGSAMRREGDHEGAMSFYVEACRVAESSEGETAALAARAAHSYERALIMDGSLDDLVVVQNAASSFGLDFVALQCGFWTACASFLRKDSSVARSAWRACLPAQLHLGHLHFLTQELSWQSELGLAMLRDPELEPVHPTLLQALARNPRCHGLLSDAMMADEGLAEIVLSQTLSLLSDDVAGPLLARAQRHRRASIRRMASSLLRGSAQISEPPVLSRRELDVLVLMARGVRNPEIAERLFLSERTVKSHVNHIFTKLGVTDRVQAVLYFKETIEPAVGQNTTVD